MAFGPCGTRFEGLRSWFRGLGAREEGLEGAAAVAPQREGIISLPSRE